MALEGVPYPSFESNHIIKNVLDACHFKPNQALYDANFIYFQFCYIININSS